METGVGLGSGGYHVIQAGRSGFRASIPVEILAAAMARARVPGEWSRAPVIGGGSGWHAIKIQAPSCLVYEQACCAQITPSLPLPLRLRWAGSPVQNVRPSLYIRTDIEKRLDFRPNLGSNRWTSTGRVGLGEASHLAGQRRR